MNRKPMPRGTKGLARKAGLSRTPEPPRATRLNQVSAKRRAQNRQRRAMVNRLWPDGCPPCFVPWCTRLADDLHEALTRARGGSITDPENAFPLCRQHHDEVTFRPESELQWAYDLGILIHSWDAPKGGEVA